MHHIMYDLFCEAHIIIAGGHAISIIYLCLLTTIRNKAMLIKLQVVLASPVSLTAIQQCFKFPGYFTIFTYISCRHIEPENNIDPY